MCGWKLDMTNDRIIAHASKCWGVIAVKSEHEWMLWGMMVKGDQDGWTEVLSLQENGWIYKFIFYFQLHDILIAK